MKEWTGQSGEPVVVAVVVFVFVVILVVGVDGSTDTGWVTGRRMMMIEIEKCKL